MDGTVMDRLLVPICAVLFVAIVGLITYWVFSGPSGQDRMDECRQMGGTVELNHNNHYEGCLIPHG